MFLADFFNHAGQFQALSGWMAGDPGAQRRQRAGEFLFRASSVHLALSRMQVLGDLCVTQYGEYKDQLHPKAGALAFWSPAVVEYLNELSPAISALRMMQNTLMPMFSLDSKQKRSLPSSMNQLMKNLDRYGLPNEITSELRAYWDRGGKRLKAYRDLDQHYGVLIDNARLHLGEPPSLQVLLPDNPEAKSRKKLTYRQEFEARAEITSQYLWLHDLTEAIARLRGGNESPLQQWVSFGQGIPVEPGVEVSLALLVQPERQPYPGLILTQSADGKVNFRQASPDKEVEGNA